MTAQHESRQVGSPLVLPFPQPEGLVRLAYRELHVAANGTPEQQQALGPHSELARPWEPSTCTEPGLRSQVWDWLEQVVQWLNHEYTWDARALVPSCWPEHPHLVHEIAVIADQRRRSGLAKTSDALEEWHRYCLPAFADRMRSRLREHCVEEHAPWPGRPGHGDFTSEAHATRREQVFAADVDALPERRRGGVQVPARPRLGLIDLETGELVGDAAADPWSRTRTRKGPHG